ncbi:MAG TPA: DUF4870 domain-containing protein [Candidatus Acidoferrales bacterium]|nr:DUF4870 domain-containing protein [Candidatus Acidoferrales bacterium]
MPFCAKCGAQVAAGATSCPSCGAAQAPSGGGAGVATGTGLDENVAGLICYVGWWITGLIFFVIDKRPFVRFHAAQSLVIFGAFTILYYVLGIVLIGTIGMGGLFFFGSIYALIFGVLRLAGLLLWILCMVKAYQHERFKLPFVGDIAENIAGK